jgi:integrase
MAKKRGNGEGTILKRKDGTWQAQATIGRETETGKLKRITFYGKTQKEVQQKLAKALGEISQGIFIEPTKISVGEWFDTWLKEYKQPPIIKLSTYVSYEMFIRAHLKPILGCLLLKDLRPEHLQKFYNDKFRNGRVDGKGGLSAKTLHNLHNMIHEGLEQAVKNNLIMRNVSKATTLPKRSKKEIRVLTLAEQKKFMKALSKERLNTAFILCLGSGLRLGELLALKWEDVNLDDGIIKVRKTLNRLKTLDEGSSTKTKLIFQDPKTEKGRRNIPIPENIITELKAHRARQRQEKIAFGGEFNELNLVFCSEAGTPLEPRSFIRKLHSIIEKSSIDHTNVHALRHTFATRLLEANEHPKVVQEMLGHANIAMTLDTYSHVMPEVKKAAAQKLNALFEKPIEPTNEVKQ